MFTRARLRLLSILRVTEGHQSGVGSIRYIAVADRGGGEGGRVPLWGSKFFHFHAFFNKKLQNNRLAYPPSGKFWIRYCIVLWDKYN